MTRIKICGLREVEHAAAAIDAGADMLGFIFYRAARRYVEPTAVREILLSLPRDRAAAVGVFVNEDPDVVREVADLVGLDFVQLSGDEPETWTSLVGRPVIRTVHVGSDDVTATIRQRTRGASVIHLDAKKAGAYGGTGTTFDWRIAANAVELGDILLAGGLTVESVADAISTARPWGVDVSSGVELDGRKDAALIHAFVAAAREADRSGGST